MGTVLLYLSPNLKLYDIVITETPQTIANKYFSKQINGTSIERSRRL
jgi:hypothetical protein